MQGWDFTSPGWYFLTLSTKNMRSEFGTVVNGKMTLNKAGKIAERFWQEIPQHFPRAVVDEHIVMPNHIHGLLQLTEDNWHFEGHATRREAFGKPVAGSIPTIVRSYKAAVSRALGRSVWQSRFYEVRARDEAARENIRHYIRQNPTNFSIVEDCGEPQYTGNKELLKLPKVGFLASRGGDKPHGKLPLKAGEAVISGFLSPMERTVLQACLKHKRPAIWIATACHDDMESTLNTLTVCREAIETGHLLVLSPFTDHKAPNARRATWCNQYVLAHCNRAIIGHLNPDGMLACILSEASQDKEIIYL